MHRGVWVPHCGKEPFFPLGPHRRSWDTRSQGSIRLPAAGIAESAPSGIIPTPSLRCASRSHGIWFGSYLVVLFVAAVVYDTVQVREPVPSPIFQGSPSPRNSLKYLDSIKRGKAV